jgi:hypothetical protein
VYLCLHLVLDKSTIYLIFHLFKNLTINWRFFSPSRHKVLPDSLKSCIVLQGLFVPLFIESPLVMGIKQSLIFCCDIGSLHCLYLFAQVLWVMNLEQCIVGLKKYSFRCAFKTLRLMTGDLTGSTSLLSTSKACVLLSPRS